MGYHWRTHHCGELRAVHVNHDVVLSGWVHRRRDHGGLIFIDLRDKWGLTQLVFDPQINKQAHQLADSFRGEWVVRAAGKVRARGEGMVNSKLATGEVEVDVESVSIISRAKTPPFSICEENGDVNDEVRLKYRYLDMRRGTLLQNLTFRHELLFFLRRFLHEKEFIEVQTPILAKSTPEGARDYLVPSRVYPGTFYALPQSPQVFKQLLMVGGVEQYFQIAPCFRDEDLRSDRQPEFTQLDMEWSFSTEEQLFSVIEEMMERIFLDVMGCPLETPFLRLSYGECMERFGTDKPDLRFGMELHALSTIVQQSTFSVFLDQLNHGGVVKGLCIKGGAELSRREIELYIDFVKRFGLTGLAWMKVKQKDLSSNIAKFFPPEIRQQLISTFSAEEGDLLFMAAEEEDKVNQALDHLRRKIAADRSLIPSSSYQFLWVTDFPLFFWDRQGKRWESGHHPFTAPHREDEALLESKPGQVRSSSYDLVLNGFELGSGSRRIHDSNLQNTIFSLLQLSEEEATERFGFFLEALKYGTPPHLGIALGLERLLMILLETDNIRDVIAFPKTSRAVDLMCQSPSPVDQKQLQELALLLET